MSGLKVVVLADLSRDRSLAEKICTKLSGFASTQCTMLLNEEFEEVRLVITPFFESEISDFIDRGDSVILAIHYDEEDEMDVYNRVINAYLKIGAIFPLILISTETSRLKFFISKTLECTLLFPIKIYEIKIGKEVDIYNILANIISKGNISEVVKDTFEEEMKYCSNFIRPKLVKKLKERAKIGITDRISMLMSMSYIARFKSPFLNLVTTILIILMVYLGIQIMSYLLGYGGLLTTIVLPISISHIGEIIIKPLMTLAIYWSLLKIIAYLRKRSKIKHT